MHWSSLANGSWKAIIQEIKMIAEFSDENTRVDQKWCPIPYEKDQNTWDFAEEGHGTEWPCFYCRTMVTNGHIEAVLPFYPVLTYGPWIKKLSMWLYYLQGKNKIEP